MIIADRYTLSLAARDRGLGEAWVVRDEQANRVERLMKLHPLGAISESDASSLVAQLRATSASGFATVIDGGVWRGQLFLVHETCAGRSLRDWLDGWRTTLTPPSQAVLKAIFLALCSALHEAQGQGLTHDRLNPRSIVITSIKSARPILVFDAGLSSVLSGEDQTACVDYLAPDARRADLFALGVILAELLTLRATPRADSRETWEQAIRNGPKRSLASLAPCPADAPAEVWKLVERMLFNRNDPDVATASKVRQAARKAWESGGVRDEPPDSLREAPLPAAMPAGARVSAPSPRETPAPARRRDVAPQPEAPPAPQRAAVVQAFSVPVASPPVAKPQAPVMTAPVAKPPPVAVPSAPVGGDTLVDFDDDASTDVARAISSRPVAVAPIAPRAVGGDTLPIDDDSVVHHAHYGDGAETLLFDPPPRGSTPQLVAPNAEVSPSDPFAGLRRVGGDTLPIDDAGSPMIADVIRPVAPHHTLVGGSGPAPQSYMPKTLPIEPASSRLAPNAVPLGAHPFVVRNTPSDTLPLDDDAAPMQAIAPMRPLTSAAPPRVSAPQVSFAQPVRETIATEASDGRQSTLRLVAAVVLGGVLLGVLITLALR